MSEFATFLLHVLIQLAAIVAAARIGAWVGLIAINVGREMGVVPGNVFCMLVIMALVTTFLTAPIQRRILSQPNPQPSIFPVNEGVG